MDDAPPSLSAREIARLTTEEIFELAAETSRHMASLAGLVVLLTGELDRREGWRDDGATSVEDWLVERTGVSMPTAKTYAHVGERLFDLPHLASGLSSGALSLDKVRAVADVATPESDREIADAAATLSVKDLTQLARSHKKPTHPQRCRRPGEPVAPLQRHVPHHHRPAAARLLRRGQGPPRGAGQEGRRRDEVGPASGRLLHGAHPPVRSPFEGHRVLGRTARRPCAARCPPRRGLDPLRRARAGRLDQRRRDPTTGLRLDADHRGRRRRRPHHVRGPPAAARHADPAPRDLAA